jgi:hypothetical protein
MLMDAVLERFVVQAPLAVAVRGTLEYALAPEPLDALFEELVGVREDRHLLFSTCVDLLAAVVCRVHRSVNTAHRADETIPVSVAALYRRLQRIPLDASQRLVRHTAARLAPLIRHLGGAIPDPIPGYRVRILDGNHLARTQRRLKPLRDVAAGPLPGHSLVVLDATLGLALDLFPCADAHAQERSLLGAVLDTVAAGDVWVADRNFCTTGFLFGLAARGACFVIRRHGSTLSWEDETPWAAAGRAAAGTLEEQTLTLRGPDAATLAVRRIRRTLDQPTADGTTVIEVLTNLPAAAADAAVVAEVYRSRWTVEGLFQRLTVVLACEVNTLGYPPAALFGFAVALAASNVHATVVAAVRGVHGAAAAETLSDYYVSAEVARTASGLEIAVAEATWSPVGSWSVEQMAGWLRSVVRRAKLDRYRKTRRGPKKPKPRRTRFARKKHIATDRLLRDEHV